MLRRQITKLFMIDSPRPGNNHARRCVVLLHIIDQIILRQGPNVLFRTQNGPSQPRKLIGCGVQVIQHQLFLLLVDFGHFSQNDIAFAFNGGGFQFGVQQNVTQNFHRLAHIVLEDLGKVHSLFATGVGIEVTAHVLNFDFELLLGAFFRALEGQVLQKVRHAVVLGRLVTRSGVNPDSDRGSLTALDCFGGHAQARVERRDIRGGSSQDIVGECRRGSGGSSSSSGCRRGESTTATKRTRRGLCCDRWCVCERVRDQRGFVIENEKTVEGAETTTNDSLRMEKSRCDPCGYLRCLSPYLLFRDRYIPC